MDYIVIDLEWNQSPQGRGTEEKNFPFEIIEIGGIKLNEERKITDSFREVIRPSVYKTLHHKTKEIIPIKMEELEQGKEFPAVIQSFFDWCGTEYCFCTWGSTDLIELQRNMRYYDIRGYIERPILFYDVQKLFGLEYEGKKDPRALEYAVDYLKLDKSEHFHRALCDAWYTARIFQLLDQDVVIKNYSYDYYHNPKTREEEVHLVYENYSKDITREFATKEEALGDKEIRAAVCVRCGCRVPKKIRWFTNNSKNYYCLAYCKEHGFIKGKLRIKKSIDERYFVVKTMKLVDEADAQNIRMRKEEIKTRRQEKRIRKSENHISID